MKAIIIISSLMTLGCAVSNRTGEVSDRDGFSIVSEQRSITVSPGEATETRLKIVRSAHFPRSPIKLSSSGLPDNVKIEFEPNPAADSAIMRLTALSVPTSSTVTLIVSGQSRVAGWPKRGIVVHLNLKPSEETLTALE